MYRRNPSDSFFNLNGTANSLQSQQRKKDGNKR